MKTWILIIQLLIIDSALSGQPDVTFLRFSHEIESGVAEGTMRSSHAATMYSLIGDYHSANTYSDIPVSWGVDSIGVNTYKTEGALAHIINEAKKHQIVVISENHLKPQHRIFANQVITELSQHGFKHLGLETLTNISNSNSLYDSTIVSRGYPLDSPITGTYTMEPKMGEIVRNALTLDYHLFAYERSEKIKGKDRDEIQADNIIKYLNNNPGSKYIVICGFHHAIESGLVKRGKHNWMAKYLKDKTGIDPLTIYQDNFTEKFINNEHRSLSEMSIDQPSIFIDSNGEIAKLSNHVDIEVIHPKTTYIDGRPNWLYENDNFTSVKIKMGGDMLRYPVIVSAFPKGEIDSVPVDRIELKHKFDNKVLVLNKGDYRITIFDGNTTLEYEEKVK